ncbi:MAG: CARDB domain-containing protein [Saprospiraceae bacterium]
MLYPYKKGGRSLAMNLIALFTLICFSAANAQTDLSVTVSGVSGSVGIYTNTLITVQVENLGSTAVSSATIEIPIPNNLAFVGQTVSAGNYNSWTTFWNLSNIQPGDVETVELTLFLLSEDPITVSSQLGSSNPVDGNNANNNGSFTINGTGDPGTPLADLIPQGISFPASLMAGESGSFSANINNIGNADAGSFVYRIYLSNDQTVDAGDIELASANSNGIVSGSNISISNLNLNINPNTNPGNYFLILAVDTDGDINESNENNNIGTKPVNITGVPNPNGGVDLELSMSASNLNPPIYSNVTVSLTLFNNGGENASNILVHLPFPNQMAYSGQTVPAGTTYNFWDGIWQVPAIGAGQSMTLDLQLFTLNTNTVTIFSQETQCSQPDDDSTPNNNNSLTPVEDDEAVVILNAGTGGGQMPDCIVGIVSVEPQIEPGDLLTFDIKARNVGNAPAGMNHLKYYLSTDNNLSANDLLLGVESFTSIPAMDYIPINKAVMIPGNVQPGNYYLIFKGDADNEVVESNEGNNLNSKPVQVISGGGMGGNDLIDLELNITTNKTSFNLYEYINFDLVLTNFGTDEATSITVSVPFPQGVAYASKSESLGIYNQYLDRWDIPALAPGETATMRLTVFTLQPTAFDIFAEVILVSQQDADSSPANGMNPTPQEDDEAYAQVVPNQFTPPGGVQDRNAAADRIIYKDFTPYNVYPNPVETEVTLSYFSNLESLHYGIFNERGQMVREGDIQDAKGFHAETFNVSDLPSGMYFILVQSSGKSEPVRFLKIRS